MRDESRIPTNLRTLLILEAMAKAGRPLTPTELNEDIGLPKQTIHRLFKTLEAEGFIIREIDKNRYRPSRRLREISSGLLHASDAAIQRHQILLELSKTVRETINFVVPEEDGMRYIDRVETDWPFQIQLPRGSNVPFHVTASGKVFMASMRKAARERFVKSLTLSKHTDQTLDTEEKLLDELSAIAKRGYALDNEEFMDGMSAIAVPVFDHQNRFVAALATHGPVERIREYQAEELSKHLSGFVPRLRDAIFGPA